MARRLTPVKTKALILSALLLAPLATAGAAAVQSVPTPAQDFRVSYTTAAVATTPSIFSKTDLPQVLSDEELEGVTGEGPAAGALVGGVGFGVGAVVTEAGKALSNYVKTGETKTTWSEVKTVVGASILGGMASGAVVGFFFPSP